MTLEDYRQFKRDLAIAAILKLVELFGSDYRITVMIRAVKRGNKSVIESNEENMGLVEEALQAGIRLVRDEESIPL